MTTGIMLQEKWVVVDSYRNHAQKSLDAAGADIITTADVIHPYVGARVGSVYHVTATHIDAHMVYGAAEENQISRQEVVPGHGRPIFESVSYTHLRAHETDSYLVCRLLLEKKKKKTKQK